LPSKTNRVIVDKKGNEYLYYRITKTVGKKLNKAGVWVPNRQEFLGKNKTDAEKQYQDYIAKKRTQTIITDFCFGEIADYYIYNVFKVSNYALNTKEKYIRIYEQVLRTSEIAGKHISEIYSSDWQDFFNDSPFPPSSMQTAHNVIRLIYKYIEKEGYGKDISHNLTVPTNKTNRNNNAEIIIWEESELEKIVANLNQHRYRLLILLGLHTGCRIGELLGLEYKSISFSKMEFRVEQQVVLQNTYDGDKRTGRIPTITDALKTKNSYRTLPLTDEIVEEIKRHIKWQEEEMVRNGYRTTSLFTTSTGRLYDQSNLGIALKRYYKRIGVPNKVFHTYRHTFATKLSRAGVPIQVLSKLLGHESIQVTNKYYINISDEEKRDAVSKINIKPRHLRAI